MKLEQNDIPKRFTQCDACTDCNYNCDLYKGGRRLHNYYELSRYIGQFTRGTLSAPIDESFYNFLSTWIEAPTNGWEHKEMWDARWIALYLQYEHGVHVDNYYELVDDEFQASLNNIINREKESVKKMQNKIHIMEMAVCKIKQQLREQQNG